MKFLMILCEKSLSKFIKKIITLKKMDYEIFE
jgi:hypothetical protein